MFQQDVTPMIKGNLAFLDSFKPIDTSLYNRDELIRLYWQYHPRFTSMKVAAPLKGRLLDVGGGSGGMTFWKEYLYPFRNDLSMSIVDLQKGEFFDRYEKYAILNLDTDELPFEAGSFDCIMLSHLIEHVQDWKLLLQKINKVLRKNGVVYIETPSKHTVDLPSKTHYVNKGMLCTTINFFDDNTHVATTDLDEAGAYANTLNMITLEKGYVRSVYFEDMLISYGLKHKDQEASQYGLWSKLLFSSYLILQKM